MMKRGGGMGAGNHPTKKHHKTNPHFFGGEFGLSQVNKQVVANSTQPWSTTREVHSNPGSTFFPWAKMYK